MTYHEYRANWLKWWYV